MHQTSFDRLRRKRELRMQIGGLRRRIDRRARAAQSKGGRLLSWRAAVRRLPGSALLTAFGVGLALAGGLSARSLARWLGLAVVRHSIRRGRRVLWAELQRLWADSAKETTRHD